MVISPAGVEGDRELNFSLGAIREGNNQHRPRTGQEELRIGPDGIVFLKIRHSGLPTLGNPSAIGGHGVIADGFNRTDGIREFKPVE